MIPCRGQLFVYNASDTLGLDLTLAPELPVVQQSLVIKLLEIGPREGVAGNPVLGARKVMVNITLKCCQDTQY